MWCYCKKIYFYPSEMAYSTPTPRVVNFTHTHLATLGYLYREHIIPLQL